MTDVKNAVMIFVNVIFWVFTMVTAMTISGRMNRSVELQSNLSTAVEAAASRMMVETVKQEGSEKITESTIMVEEEISAAAVEEEVSAAAVEEEVFAAAVEEEAYSDGGIAVAECIQYLVAALDTDSKVQVDVMKSDTKKGVLAIRVTENFKHPNGKDGTVTCDRIAIWEREIVEEEETEQYEVKFYRTKADMAAEENCYKAYTVREGDRISAPAAPRVEGAVFAGWRDGNDYVADFSEPIEQNQAYYAEW